MKKKSKYIAVGIGVALFLLFSTVLILNTGKDFSQNLATNDKVSMVERENTGDYDFTIYSNADYIAIKPEDLYKNADLVVIANYNCDNKNYIGNSQSIITEANFDVQKVIKGEYKNNKIDINYYGGSVSLNDYIKCLSSEQMKKSGLDTLTDEEINKGKVTQVIDKSQIKVKNDENYLIFLSYDREKNIYFVLADGYGMRKLSEDNKIFNLDTNSYDMSLDDLNV